MYFGFAHLILCAQSNIALPYMNALSSTKVFFVDVNFCPVCYDQIYAC